MQCPQCSTTLVMSERQGVEIDHCPRCRGVWLERGELEKVIARSNAYFATYGRVRTTKRTMRARAAARSSPTRGQPTPYRVSTGNGNRSGTRSLTEAGRVGDAYDAGDVIAPDMARHSITEWYCK